MSFELLIAGAGRGGTSLLMGLLDAHPQLEIGNELFSVQCLMNEQLPAAERIVTFVGKCEEEARKHEPKLWGNKITTEQIDALSESRPSNGVSSGVKSFFSRLAEKRLIFILRDGRTCIESKVNRTGQSIELACTRWNFSVCVHDFLVEQYPETTLSVRYENLLRDPTATLTTICEFIGVPYTREMLAGTMNPKLAPEYVFSAIVKEKAADPVFKPWHKLIEQQLINSSLRNLTFRSI